MKIVDMTTLDTAQHTQAAQMLTDELPLGWAALSDAMDEVTSLLDSKENPDALLLAAVEDNNVLGWVGILPQYNGKVYELHPLVVHRSHQGKGIGAKLVAAVEAAARERGALTLYLGADDESPEGETSLANTDLYDDLPRHIRKFAPGAHQSAFYMKLGFKIIGVMPDANGRGRPDIILAKPLYS